ncbi:IS481 family transposase [Thioalkalivibrio sp. ALJ16]|uniref:IS481 family transposase n=1 Tax=Thioalkalivibrio sp. ALJ16 TaxID=1158762 RepID=UPI00035C1E79|nr:IS481 family transposase [Thioalkalivibrio sp. ALJ16]
MSSAIHVNARTTPRTRREIQQAPPSVRHRDLARRLGISRHTVMKWRHREDTQDRSHRPHRMKTALTPEQEAILIAVREWLWLSLDDLLIVAREFVQPDLSRAALDRCLRRYGVASLKALRQQAEGEPAPRRKSFKAYAPGFVHVDVKYLPKLAEESSRRYLFVAIDRATRWVYLEVRSSKSGAAARGFLKRLLERAPFYVTHVLTDNGKEFTDRFVVTGERQPTGRHPFDRLCAEHGIQHRLTKPRKPQTNGMVERFNGRIADLLRTYHIDSSEQMQDALYHYLYLYNHAIQQKALGHRTPVAALKAWQQTHPDCFRKRVYNQPRPDTYMVIRRLQNQLLRDHA